MKTIAITRPYEDAIRTARDWEAQGWQCIIEPMLSIHRREVSLEEYQGKVQGVILTSRNAVHALAQLDRNLPCFVVGTATADAAKEAGCKHLHIAGGDVVQLMELLKDHATAGMRLLYLRGAQVSRDIASELKNTGILMDEQVVYDAHAMEGFSESYAAKLRNRQIDAVAFYSRRAAQAYLENVQRGQFAECHREMQFYAASERIADVLAALTSQGSIILSGV